MKKFINGISAFPYFQKISLKMKLTTLLLIVSLFQISAKTSYSQNVKISLDVKELTLKNVLNEIEKKTDFKFLYEKNIFRTDRKISVSVKNQKLIAILKDLLLESNIEIVFLDKQIILKTKPVSQSKSVKPSNVISISEQRIEIKGTIFDSEGQPLPGATILEKNTNNGTQSDFDGKFSLKTIKKESIVVISYIGYVSQEIKVERNKDIQITLKEDASELNEVVVVGYGTLSKKDIAGSIVSIKGDAIAERSVTNISNALQGAASGLVVTRTSSAPGAGNNIRIRGNTTLEGSNSPLILVDDVPVTDINSVPPDQVASISILKDGAASAIYGSRAAAGVIIITTKRAKQGQFTVGYTGEYIINTPANEREYVDGLTFMELVNEGRWNDTGNVPGTRFPIWPEATINAYKSGLAASNRDLYPETDWKGLMLKDQTVGNRHSINISGGSNKVRSNISIGYEDQDAFYDSRRWRRYTTRINNDIQISDKFGAYADINFRLIKDDRPANDGGVIESALTTGTVYPALWSDGRLATGRDNGNPYARLLGNGFSNSDTYNFSARLGVFYEPIDGLKVTLNMAPSFAFNKYKSFTRPYNIYGLEDVDMTNPIISRGTTDLTEKRTNNNSITTQALVNFNKTFGKHRVSSVFGYEERSTRNERLGVRGQDFVSPDYPFLNNAPTDGVFESDTESSELAYSSVFGRVDYVFDDKYTVGATVRRDGSSRFGSDYRWGNFPSISGAWTVSNENFMKSILEKTPISFLKFKASYAELGNDRLGNYLHITQLQVGNYLIANGASVEEVRALSQLYLTTPDVSWETTISKNFGIEFGLFDDRLNVEAEYFSKDTEDMLLSLSVPDLVGFEDPTVNVGQMNTNGWDTSISWRDNINDFTYSISANLSDAKSTIGNINDKRLFEGNTLSEEGGEFRELYGYTSDGLFQDQEDVDNSTTSSGSVSPGDVKLLDINGPDNDGQPDGVINGFDRKRLGSSGPRYTYGGRINAGYKGFDFSLAFQGVGKQQFYLQPNLVNVNNVVRFTQDFADNIWSLDNPTEENLSAIYPRNSDRLRGNNYTFSDFWLRNGAYLKIKTLSLGYTLPTQAIAKTGFSKIRIYASGNDLFSFHNLPPGIDPEQTNGYSYYITKSVVLGLNVNF